MPQRTLLIGLGNAILTDDGVGIRVAEAVEQRLPAASGVDVREACLGGLRLMEEMVGYDRVIIVDAMYPPAEAPGRFRRLTLDELPSLHPTHHTLSPHDTSLPQAVAIGHQMGLPLPTEIVLFAVDVANVTDFSEEPTAAVRAAIPDVTEAVLREMDVAEPVRSACPNGFVTI